MINKAQKLLWIFLPFLIVFTFLCLAVDTVLYPGAIANHFFIDSKFYFASSLVFLLFFSKKTKFLDWVLRINSILLLPLIIIYLTFIFIETSHFPNYVLSAFHFHLDGLVSLVLFCLSLFIIRKTKNEFPKVKTKFIWSIYLIVILLITYFGVVSASTTFNTALVEDFYVFLHPKATYDDKMYFRWGDFYRFMVFIENNTSENATIILPPRQLPWYSRTGDLGIVRAFLFPRNLIDHPSFDVPNFESLPEGTYILISWGEADCNVPNCYGWPRQTIKASEIIFKDPNSSKAIEIRENSTYDPKDTRYVYGLIKI